MADPIYTTEKYCQLLNETNYEYIFSNKNTNSSSSIAYSNSTQRCLIYSNDDHISMEKKEANIALLSLILLIGTCTLALALKKLRRSIFFGAYVSRLDILIEQECLK
jgi:hypothetical protein